MTQPNFPQKYDVEIAADAMHSINRSETQGKSLDMRLGKPNQITNYRYIRYVISLEICMKQHFQSYRRREAY